MQHETMACGLNARLDPDMDPLFEKNVFTKGAAILPYRLLKPDGYAEDGTDHYPLVIFLHGIGERGTDNESQLRNGVEEFAKDSTRKRHPSFLVVPQCPPDKLWCQFTPGDTKRNLPMASIPTEPTALVLDLMDTMCKAYRVDTQRIYLTGVSMGGYGVWALIARKPAVFAAAIPVCGGGDPAQAEKLTHLPIWVFHGEEDDVVPAERSRDMIAAIRRAGGEPRYTEFKGVGHDSWTPTYQDVEVLDWLFSQKQGGSRA